MNDSSYKFAKAAVTGYAVFAAGIFGHALGLSLETARMVISSGGLFGGANLAISMLKSRAVTPSN